MREAASPASLSNIIAHCTPEEYAALVACASRAIAKNILRATPVATVLLCWHDRADGLFGQIADHLQESGVAVIRQRWDCSGIRAVARRATPGELARLWAPEWTDSGLWRIFGKRAAPADVVLTSGPRLVKSSQNEDQRLWEAVERAGYKFWQATPPPARARVLQIDWPTGARKLPGLNLSEDWLVATTLRALAVDQDELRSTNHKLASVLRRASRFRLRCPAGTDLQLQPYAVDPLCEDGRWGEGGDIHPLPGGEVYLPVLESSGNGVAVIDVGGRPATLTLRNGLCVAASGPGARQPRLLEQIERCEPLGELGLGTNWAVPPLAVGSWVEKAAGTAHLGFGANARFGGSKQGDFHVDWMIRSPELWGDFGEGEQRPIPLPRGRLMRDPT